MYIIEWISALESGKYQQGIGCLCQPVDGIDRFCVLGVLGDLLVRDNHARWVTNRATKSLHYKDEYSVYSLRDTWLEELQIPNITMALPMRLIPSGLSNRLPDNGLSLVELNDEGYSFLHLARIIRELYHVNTG